VIRHAEVLTDPNLIAPFCDGESGGLWRAVLEACFAEPLNETERTLFRAVAGHDPPPRRVRERRSVAGSRVSATTP
jgi:hypothetical protein